MQASQEWLNRGGKWLGAVRSWLQWNTGNGDRVTWGSNTPIEPPLTAKNVEEIAACAAEHAAGELIEKEAQYEKLRRKHLQLTMELDAATKKLADLGRPWTPWKWED